MSRALVVHGHFYQPPRENPWTGDVDREVGAEPFHDWNDRIFHECYRANAYARIVDDAGRVERIVNNYAHINFDFGPTLLAWLERHHPITLARIVEADQIAARRRGGHGNAIAQGYNHAILPLCSPRDRVTQVRWGMADFRHRFGREPEGMWLPETAADDATLGTLIDQGLRYTILAPHQARAVRSIGDTTWHAVDASTLDVGIPYRYAHRDGSGRHIAIFFYDGARARNVAFDGALRTSQNLIELFEHPRVAEGRIASIATDGESYGHHTHFGDRSLAHALEVEAERRGFWVTNYGEFLERHPPAHEVELASGPDGLGTAWSCAHGVGRWMRDCGCKTGGQEGWSQAWRKPLRDALDLVRDACATHFSDAGGDLFSDPWDARDAYIEVVVGHEKSREEFVARHARRPLARHETERALGLLEMQRNALLMYTSCGWFFSDLAGIETIQILKYAARTLDHCEDLSLGSPRAQFLERLVEARSNRPECGHGADVFRTSVEPVRVTPKRITAHIAMTSLLDECEPAGEIAGHAFHVASQTMKTHGTITLCTARVLLDVASTLRRYDHAALAIHFGGVDFFCVLDEYPGDSEFANATKRVWDGFATASLPSLLRLAATEFGHDEFGLEHMLSDANERIANRIFGEVLEHFAESYARLYSDNRRILDMLQTAGFQLPKELLAAAEFTLGRRFEREIEEQQQSRDPSAYRRAIEIADEVARRGYRIDRTRSSRTFEHMLNHLVQLFVDAPSREHAEAAIELLELTERLSLPINRERAQEVVHASRRAIDAIERTVLDRLLALLGLSLAVRDLRAETADISIVHPARG